MWHNTTSTVQPFTISGCILPPVPYGRMPGIFHSRAPAGPPPCTSEHLSVRTLTFVHSFTFVPNPSFSQLGDRAMGNWLAKGASPESHGVDIPVVWRPPRGASAPHPPPPPGTLSRVTGLTSFGFLIWTMRHAHFL